MGGRWWHVPSPQATGALMSGSPDYFFFFLFDFFLSFFLLFLSFFLSFFFAIEVPPLAVSTAAGRSGLRTT